MEELATVDQADERPQRPDYRVIDNNTGEIVQLTLLGAQWEDYRVESLRLSLSGGGEFVKALFDQLTDGDLEPGAIVEVTARGVVKEHAPVFKKEGHEGKTVILLETVRKIKVLGYMAGSVEAAQNVDGEPKSYEEPERPECFANPAPTIGDPVCDSCPHLGACLGAVADSEAPEDPGEPADVQAGQIPFLEEPRVCGSCRYVDRSDDQHPCRNCRNQSLWEPMPAAEGDAA